MDTNKTRLAINRVAVFWTIVFGLIAFSGVAVIKEDPILGGILAGLFSLLDIALLVLVPFWYLFDKNGVRVCYFFLPNEWYLWKNVYAIEATRSDYFASSVNNRWMDIPVFALHGNMEGEHRLYMEGVVLRTHRTKKLIEAYWDGEVTGYFLDGIKKWFAKRRQKREKDIQRHLTDEIVPMERAVRANVRQELPPYESQLKQLGLELKVSFLYVDGGGEEHKSRPDSGYTYMVLVEMAHPGETDENRIVGVSADLLQVRLGRTAYRGVEMTTAIEELRFYLEDTIATIREQGIEAYCR